MRILLTILSLVWLNASANTYYFSSTGSDSYNSTQAQNPATPWQTMAKFNSIFPGTNPGDFVLFKRGDTFYGTATAGRSGSAGNPITIGAYGTGPLPIIHGFTSLTSWTNVGTNLWEASLSVGSTESMVTVGGAIVGPGRFPNSSWLTLTASGPSDAGWPSNQSTFTTATPSPSLYVSGGVNANVVIKKREWIIEKCAISSISGSTVNFINLGGGFPARNTWGFYFTDHPATLDQQNEWYYTSGTLRMYSTSNPSGLSVKAASLDSVFYLNNQSYITVQDIQFEGTRSHAVVLIGGSNNTFTRCTVQFSGKNGIDAQYNNNLTINQCNVNNTAWSGITTLFGNYQNVTENEIHDIALNTSICQPDNKANHGIWVNGTYNNIRRNNVYNIGYIGIDFSGNYDTARSNHVHEYALTSTDGGGIYMSDETAGVGRLIDSNVIHHGFGARDGTPYVGQDNAMGIYLDESTAGVTISNNFSSYNAGGGLYLHKAHDCIIDNNTFYGNTLRQALFAEDGGGDTRMVNLVMTNNILHSLTSTDYIYVIYAVDGLETFFTKMSKNVLSRPSSSTNIIYEIINYFAGGDYNYSLAQFRTAFANYEIFSTGTPTAFASGTPVVEYNPTSAAVASTLPGLYTDIKDKQYNAGLNILQPYASSVLIKTNDLPTLNVSTQKNKGIFSVKR